MKKNITLVSAIAACSLILAGCNSDSKSDSSNKVTSAGVITGFGSVYVNGTRYITDTSNIIHNGTANSTQDALKVGMKVVVNADKQSDGSAPVAAEIKYLSDVTGQIQEIDLVNSTLTVLGQKYVVTASTKLDGFLFKELNTDTFVEISAFKNQAGEYTANYIEIEADTNEQQLVGEISNLNADLKTFSIGNLAVDYNTAEVEGSLANGITVEIETNQALRDNVFIATEVEVEDDSFIKGDELAISGIVNLIQGDNFILDEQAFTLTSDTEFTQGTKADLVAGSQVSLIAKVTNNESFEVTKVRIELANKISIEAVVEAVTETSFTLLGQEFSVDAYTQYEDESATDLRNFTFTDIAVGDLLEVDAFDNAGTLVSRSIEREEINAVAEEAEVEGKVSSIDSPNLSIKGVVVATNNQTEFENAEGLEVTQAEFFATIALDDLVEAELAFVDGQWVAIEIEVEDEENKEVELAGSVDSFESSERFTVSGFTVITTENTIFENGSKADLAQGNKLDIEGRVNTAGEITAEEIEFLQK